MALTETGFKRRTFDEILTAKIELAKELFGEDIDTSELTPFGKFIRINAKDQSLTEEEAEAIYYSIFPNTAVGVSLDRLCVFAGISRNAATKALYTVTFTGTAGAVIPQGFLVGTESGMYFALTEETTIGENGTVDAVVECTGSRDNEAWDGSGEVGNNVSAQEINTIVNPVADVDSVTGVSIVYKAEEAESDYDLRNRFSKAIEGLGSCNEAAIKSALLRVPTVTHAEVIANENNGSFACYVNGSTEAKTKALIAEAIFDKKAVGIKTTGGVSQVVTDDGGTEHTINFSYVDNIKVSVYVSGFCTTSEFEGDAGFEEIKNNITTAINSVEIGGTLAITSLYNHIYSVKGVKSVASLYCELELPNGNWETVYDAYDAGSGQGFVVDFLQPEYWS